MVDDMFRGTMQPDLSAPGAALGDLYDAIWEWNLETDEVYYSPAWKQMLGYTADELAPNLETWNSLCHPEDRERTLATIREYLAGGGDSYDAEFRLRHADGQWRQILSRATLVRDRDGRPREPRRIIGTHVDLTSHAEAERRLAKSLSLLRATLDATADGILVVDGHGRIETFNRRFAELWCLPAGILAGGDDDAALAFVLDQLVDPQGFLAKVRELYAQPVAESFDVLRFRDGRVFERYSRPQRLADTVVGRVWSFRDITDREQAVDALADQARRSRALFEQSRDGIVVIDMTGRAIECNERFAEMLGRTTAEIATMHAWEWDATMSGDLIRERFLHRQLPPHQFATKHRRRDGSVVDVEISTGSLDWGGQPLYLCTVRDVSGRLRAEEERQQLQEQLLQAQKMDAIGQLTGGIAHEFNNMLGVVLGYATLAHDVAAAKDDDALAEYLAAIRRAGENARDLVAKLLAFGRRRPVARREPQDPVALVTAALHLLRPALPTSLRIEVDLPPELPAVAVDPMEFQQVIANLLLNASQATGQQGTVQVRLRAWRAAATCASCRLPFAGPHVALSVIDDGVGIRPEAHGRIFEPFFTTKEAGHGTGLGLPVVHGIVHAVGGHVLVDAAAGRGATFTLLLPPCGIQAAAPAPAPAAPGVECVRARRFLVVDDRPEIAGMLGLMLDARGHRAAVHDNALAALAAFRADPAAFDAVIADQTMPDMPGRDLLLAIRQVRADLPLVICTGYSETMDEAEAATLGFAGFMRKPVTMEDLDALLERLF